MKRTALAHPSKAILIHIPTASLDHLDGIARETQLSRSEIIRQMLSPPAESDAPTRGAEAPNEQPAGCPAPGTSQQACGRIKLG
jgi:crotonobetainyl-CoA:carnitine CoA-transferase CaiB-like acyl-CoA transferase